jgi:rhamnogalacturonan endolyase
LPSKDAIAKEIVVQDATWTFNNTPSDPYVTQFSDYFTKYTFSNRRAFSFHSFASYINRDISLEWRNNSVHGLYADGTTSDGATYGAWLVMNTKVNPASTI